MGCFVWVTGSTYLTTSATYNSNGTVASTTDVNQALTNYFYNGTGGCNDILLTSISLPVSSLSSSQTWNCDGGVVTSATDANGQVTKFGFVNQSGIADPLWRRLSVTDPLNNVTWTSYSPGSTLPATQETALSFGSSTVDVLTTLDGLGRPVLEQTRQGPAPGTTTFDNVQYGYNWNSVGFITTQSLPYQGTGPVVNANSEFDALGRASSVIDGGGGSVTLSYAQNDVLRRVRPAPAGENNKSRQLEYDGLGRITSVCEIIGSGGTSCGQKTTANGYKTVYTYTVPAAGGTKLVVTQGVQSRTYVRDGLGRLISETNPENGP